jgi:mRNA-degrading endonuclease RelE of RelBE toxin-antitoxin system
VAYRIQFAELAEDHFGQLTTRQRGIVLDAVRVQLQHEPLYETRNRKRLRPNPLAPWELRVGALRVFYEVDAGESDLVNILAIGVKRGNRLFIAGKEIRI